MKIAGTSKGWRPYATILISSLTLCGSSLGATISLGDTVTGELGSVTGPGGLPPMSTTVVDPGVEFDFGMGTTTLDVREDAFDIVFNLPSSPGIPLTWTLSSLSDIQSVTLTSGDPSFIDSIVFTETSIDVNFPILAGRAEPYAFSFAVTGTPVEPPVGTVPEPSGILVLGLLLGGGTFLRSRRS